MGHLSIFLLGRLEVTLAGKAVTGFRSDKARLLLSYLAMDSTRAHRRRALAGLFWPASVERRALRSLTTTLANIRQIIADADQEPPFLLVNHGSLRFNPVSDHSLDVASLDRLSAHRRANEMEGAPVDDLRQAVSLYRGEFLEGFSLADCPELEEWLLLQRERYRQVVLRALRRLAEHGLGMGDWIAAEENARRCLTLDPWDERAHRQVMAALALSGQRSAALAAYESCRLRLADELGIEPEGETIALGEAIRHGEAPSLTGVQGEELGASPPTRSVARSPAAPTPRACRRYGPVGL